MGFALRCLFFLVVLVALGALIVLYRRRVNTVLIALTIGYAIAIGSRLLQVEADDELVIQSLIAVGGLAVVWAVAWLGARWFPKRR